MKRKALPEKYCLACNIIFSPKTIRSKFCSKKCTRAYWRKTHREQQNEYSKKWHKLHYEDYKRRYKEGPRKIIIEKLCSLCQKNLPVLEFSHNRGMPDGFQYACKQCLKNQIKRRSYEYMLGPKRYQVTKSAAQKRELEWEINEEQYWSFLNQYCSYCGDPLDTVRLDRIDNTKGYTLDNITPCCGICNRMKGTMIKENFLNKCHQITLLTH